MYHITVTVSLVYLYSTRLVSSSLQKAFAQTDESSDMLLQYFGSYPEYIREYPGGPAWGRCRGHGGYTQIRRPEPGDGSRGFMGVWFFFGWGVGSGGDIVMFSSFSFPSKNGGFFLWIVGGALKSIVSYHYHVPVGHF